MEVLSEYMQPNKKDIVKKTSKFVQIGAGV